MMSAISPGRLRSRRVAARARGVDPLVLVAVVAFAVVKVLQVVLTAPSRYPDSPTYRVEGHFLDLSLTSLGGHSIRPWGVTAWMALWPSDEALTVAQGVLSAVVWSVLAITVSRVIRRAALRRAVVVLLLLLSCTAQVSGWDVILLGESVSISAGVLALAALIRFTRESSWTGAVLFLLAALWFTMTRPNIFVILLAWAATFLVVGLLRRQVAIWGAVAGALVAFSLYSYVYNIRADATWTKDLGYSRTTVSYGYPISQNGPVAEAVLRDLRQHSDAPGCMIPPSPFTVSDNGTTRWIAETVKACPGMDEWATKNWHGWWASWLLHHPDKTLEIVGVELPNSLSPPVWSGITAATPNSVSSIFFGSAALPQSALADQTYRNQPLLIWLAAAGALAVFARRRRRGGDWSTEAVLFATVGGCLASAISSGLLIQTAPFEVGQESMGAVVVLTASCIALVGLGLDRAQTLPDEGGDDVGARGSSRLF
jgi:hypothetical protein